MPYIFDALVALKKRQFTGQLLLSSDSDEYWTLYIFLGRLLYGTGGQHSVRRLYRHILKTSDDLTLETLKKLQNEINYDAKSCWEYEFLTYLVQRSHLIPTQVSKVIHGTLNEIFFDVSHHDDIQHRMHSELCIQKQLGLIDPIQLLEHQQPLWKRWKAAHLNIYSLNLAPVIQNQEQLKQNTSAGVYQTLTELLNGQSTLWDVVVATNRSPVDVMRSLLPFIQKGTIELVELPDFLSPVPPKSLPPIQTPITPPMGVTKPTETRQALVACVDDSAWVCNTLEKVVTRAGYRFLAIQDPLRAIPTLLAQKPQLILLDLLMPNTNGYEICSQLRRISAFRDTPIIILTGNDGIVDRVRAKLVGATDFLSKSVNYAQLMTALNKYLAEEDLEPLLLEK